MLKDITEDSVNAFIALTNEYDNLEVGTIDKVFDIPGLTTGSEVLSILTGFGNNCKLCEAVGMNTYSHLRRKKINSCSECIYSLHNLDNNQELHCVDSKNGNYPHFIAITNSTNATQLKKALENKVLFMRKLLKKYNNKKKV